MDKGQIAEFDRVICFQNLTVINVEASGVSLDLRHFDVSLRAEMEGYCFDPPTLQAFTRMLLDVEAENGSLITWPREKAWQTLYRMRMQVQENESTFMHMLRHLWRLLSTWLNHRPPKFLTQLPKYIQGHTHGVSFEPRVIHLSSLDLEDFFDGVHIYPQVVASLDNFTNAASPILHSSFLAEPTTDEQAALRPSELKGQAELTPWPEMPEDFREQVGHTIVVLRELMSLYLSISLVSDIKGRIERHHEEKDAPTENL